MQIDNKRKLKGFTLVELIAVLAVFSMVIYGCYMMLTPVAKQNNFTKRYYDGREATDIYKSFIDQQIRYADRLWLYEGMDCNTIAIADEVTKFADRHCKNRDDNGDGTVDWKKIYVMKIDNGLSDANTYGKISLYEYNCNDVDGSINTTPAVAFDNFFGQAYYERCGINVTMHGDHTKLTSRISYFDLDWQENDTGDLVLQPVFSNIYNDAAMALINIKSSITTGWPKGVDIVPTTDGAVNSYDRFVNKTEAAPVGTPAPTDTPAPIATPAPEESTSPLLSEDSEITPNDDIILIYTKPQ